ncbi:MAG: hypothetical protein ACYCU7_03080 [Acidimicrobiales bacterium]
MIAHFFHLSLNDTVWALRVTTFVLPTLVGLLTYRVCLDLQRIRRPREQRRRAVVRWTEGRFFEVRPERPAPAEDGLAPTGVSNVVVSADEALRWVTGSISRRACRSWPAAPASTCSGWKRTAGRGW